jgi:hypothetical protein
MVFQPNQRDFRRTAPNRCQKSIDLTEEILISELARALKRGGFRSKCKKALSKSRPLCHAKVKLDKASRHFADGPMSDIAWPDTLR